MQSLITGLLRTIGLYHPLRDLRRDREFKRKSRDAIAAWEQQGRPMPAPDLIKYGCIRNWSRQHGTPVLVETGTWMGNAIFTLRRDFREIHSIELAPQLHADAVKQLGHLRHIHLHLGDSAKELPRIAQSLDAPALYWLDGHFCAGPSARGEEDTPIVQELHFLLGRPPGRNVVLIDDARLFNGRDGYPTVEQVRALARASRPSAHFEVSNDIICIAPV